MVLKRDKPKKRGGDSDKVADNAAEAFQDAGDEFNEAAAAQREDPEPEAEVSQDAEQGDAPDLASRVTALEAQVAESNAYWASRRTDWPASLTP